jgi:hypothetical protein
MSMGIGRHGKECHRQTPDDDGRWRAFLSELSGGWTKWIADLRKQRDALSG